MTSSARELARLHLDQRLARFRQNGSLAPPPKGWIRAVRDALGMTGRQFAARLDMRPQSVADLELSEATGAIQLKTLRRAAEALDCTLVYALVPNTSLENAVQRRARRIALKNLDRVAHTMKLEDQESGDGDLEARVGAYMRDLIKDRDVWADGE